VPRARERCTNGDQEKDADHADYCRADTGLYDLARIAQFNDG